jgi:signal transduction histidine kinase
MESATPSEPRLRALVEAGMALASELSLESLLQRLTELAAELTGARYAALGVIDATGSGLERFITHGIDEACRAAIGDEPQGRGILGALITDATPLRLHAIADDSRSVGFPANHPPMSTFLGVPVVLRGVAYGNLYLTEKEGGADFTGADQELVELLASQAAVAIDLSQRVARDALRRVVAAQELERQRLARELHDETGQALTSILLGLKQLDGESPEAVAELRELVVATLQDVRRLAVELRPKVLDDFGLVPALERLTQGFAEHTGISVDLEASALTERLPVEVETAIFRIVQESLTNVVKHAHASSVSVVLTRGDGRIKAVIEDDGTGFAPETIGESGIGLVGMRERIELLDGSLTVESSERSGTTVAVEVPVR